MALVAAAWVAWPLMRPKAGNDALATPTERRLLTAALAVIIPLAAAGLYMTLSTWKWNDPDVARAMQMSRELREMQARVRKHPQDVGAWQALGREYLQLGQFGSAVNAYERAYRLSGGQDPDIATSLGEALVLKDENALQGRAGELFEEALKRSPMQPKALFYSSIGALRSGNLTLARDRFKLLLAQNPPEQMRQILQRQIQDLDEQIAAGSAAAAVPAAAGRVVKVSITVADAIREQLREPLTLFILARDPSGGPPLAVERHSSSDLPLTVELSAADAMLPSRTIENVAAAQIVARLSRSGAPQQQSGDYFGEVHVQFDDNTAAKTYDVDLVIDRRVP
jgi:cytochrome c-type biogenesis protein CcmH